MGDWVYGCDICQEVCPYTKAARPDPDPEFLPAHIDHAYPSLRWLLTMDDAAFRSRYAGRATLRTRRAGLARNAAVALGNVGTEADLPVLLDAALHHDEALVRGHAAWAVGRLAGRGVVAGPAAEKARDTLLSLGRQDGDESVRSEADAALVVASA
jgi:epoxyqueuosine reductase